MPRDGTDRPRAPAGWLQRLATTAIAVALTAACAGTGEGDPTEAGAGDRRDATPGPPAVTAAPPPDDGEGDDDPPPTTTTEPPEPRRFTLAATGDFLLHMPVHDSALRHGGGERYDFTPMLAEVAPELRAADLAICHMETPLSADNTDLAGFPMFNASRDIATAAADAGFDACSTASNHSLDRGMDGLVQTLDVLDDAGLGHAGTARSAAEADAIPLHEVDGGPDAAPVTVAHLAYTYGLNGIPLPPEAPWAVNLIDEDEILADAGDARSQGADVVVVSMHWGAEYQVDPTETQIELAEILLGSDDVDTIIGAHAHVVQPVERIGGDVVVYGLGNFLSNQVHRERTLDGVIVHLDYEERPDGSFGVDEIRYTPTRVDPDGHIIRPVTPTSDPASFERTRDAIERRGVVDATPTPSSPSNDGRSTTPSPAGTSISTGAP